MIITITDAAGAVFGAVCRQILREVPGIDGDFMNDWRTLSDKKPLHRLAWLSTNLIGRTADVTPKEHRRLALIVREALLNLCNTTAETEMSASLFRN